MNEKLKDLFENFGKAPDEPPPPVIPQRWRIPVFATMAIVAAILLALLLWLYVIPAIQANSAATSSPSSTTHSAP